MTQTHPNVSPRPYFPSPLVVQDRRGSCVVFCICTVPVVVFTGCDDAIEQDHKAERNHGTGDAVGDGNSRNHLKNADKEKVLCPAIQ